MAMMRGRRFLTVHAGGGAAFGEGAEALERSRPSPLPDGTTWDDEVLFPQGFGPGLGG
jgi:hypothetical protein